MVFSSDTVLKNITPNPVLSPDPIDEKRRFQSLGEYLVSLARLRALAPTVLKGGHGDSTEIGRSYGDFPPACGAAGSIKTVASFNRV